MTAFSRSRGGLFAASVILTRTFTAAGVRVDDARPPVVNYENFDLSALEEDFNRTIVVSRLNLQTTWEGWGVSLDWWAGKLGDNDALAEILFDRKERRLTGILLPGLHLNIVRCNLGGSGFRTYKNEQMQSSPNIYRYKQVQGFWQDGRSDDPNSPSWDWSVDAKQNTMMQKAKHHGVKLFELFSNSPMWWMLNNLNPSGANKSSVNNLSPRHVGDFVKYLAITIERFKADRDIKITSVSPFNEPSADWWKASNGQEGCFFDSHMQQRVIRELTEELKKRGLDDVTLAASEESLYDQAVHTWRSFPDTTRSLIGKVNVHGYEYANGKRSVLKEEVGNTTLWNSEYSDGSGPGLQMAANIHRDFHWLKPSAWVYWQAVDETDGWGFFQANLHTKKNYEVNKVNGKYWVMAHYTRHIQPGMTILESSDENTIVAYDAQSARLVLVAVNYRAPQTLTIDFSGLKQAKGPVRRWRTETHGKEKYQPSTYELTDGVFKAHLETKTVHTFEIDRIRFN
eukprot:TRINITY_DN4849_c0_g2_i1.p1 TRINITY_DN4849_c0_g2~~TRINITY_DN4849_c0_g2_i1.p1  ORF type:complete len:512 (-),score=91.38 TRINITY_DN4849_c0_g2_i1:223-1758(-)